MRPVYLNQQKRLGHLQTLASNTLQTLLAIAAKFDLKHVEASVNCDLDELLVFMKVLPGFEEKGPVACENRFPDYAGPLFSGI